MNCKEAQLHILQFAEARPAADVLAHARSCEGCRRALEEMIQHQTWLRRQFAEVSARLLADAPVVTEEMLRERLQRLPPPTSRARPLLWAAGLVAVVAVAGVMVWQAKHRAGVGPASAAPPLKAASVGAKRSGTNVVARAAQKPSPATAKPRPKQKSKLKGAEKPGEFDPDALEMALKSSTPPSDAAGAKPPAASEAGQAGKPMPATGGTRTLALAAGDVIPTASGNIAVAAQQAADGSPSVSVAMNLHGLAAETPYTIVGLDASGQRVVLANVITDANGAATAPLATGALPGVSLSDAMTGTGSPGWLRGLVVLDTAGNTILTVSPTPETPAQTPAAPVP
ncbi:MAG: hypothetical protein HZA91_08500 [Verrucomicrobia bacterium]|nr:hypothetical protein [Verrucomicrobiota bacterium]